MRRYHSALLRAKRETSRPSTRPTRASATSAVSRAKPERVVVPPPDRPRVFINDDDPFGGPAELTSLAGERVLPFSRFAIVLDLSGAGLTQIDDSMAREMARRDFAALIHGSPRSLPSPACGQSGAPGSRAQRSARARRAVPRGSVRGSPKEHPPVDRTGRKRPDLIARRLPFCGGADPNRSAAESVDEMAQLKQIAKAAQSTRAEVGFLASTHAATVTFVP